MNNSTLPDVKESSDTVKYRKQTKETKMERYLRLKEARRANRKAKKNRKKERRIKEEIQGLKPMKNSPNQAIVPMHESACRTKIVIDCAYDHLMSFKDVCKLAHQISHCYAINRKLRAPVQLYVTGLTQVNDNSTSNTQSRLNICCADKWDIFLKSENYEEIFPSSSIVYLCAESNDDLPDLIEPIVNDVSTERNDVYVIGGLVDHNSHPGFCYRQAMERKHRTARLPINRVGIKMTSLKVLSIVHVFQALASVVSGEADWATALREALPSRKVEEVTVDNLHLISTSSPV